MIQRFILRLTNENVIQIILHTTNDYLQDIIHLKLELSNNLLYKWHNKIKSEYLNGFLQKYFYRNQKWLR